MSFSERKTEAERLLRFLSDHAPDPSGVPQIPRYELRGRLGEGATAVVYRAWDRELGRQVAVKILREAATLSKIVRERFHREARAAAVLAHPHLVTVHDVGEVQGRLYLVMELVEGPSFHEILRQRRHSPRDLLSILEKVARGVAAAHEKGVVHRDLKPANILVTPQGEPKVGDFGLAHLSDSPQDLTRTGAALGTPLYMAPEQVLGGGKEVTPRADVYALGTILYEAAVGRVPHEAANLAELYARIVNDEPVPPRKAAPELSRELEAIIQKAMEKDPARRYATAATFADDLAQYLAGEPVSARPQGPIDRLARRVRRRPGLYALGAFASILLILGGLVVYAGLEKSRRLREEEERSLSGLRRQARISLEAALRLRRAGVTEGLRDFLPTLESAYRETLERAPQIAEVEYLMGRMCRALFEDERALSYQDRALAKQPDYAPALYERIVLRSEDYGVRLENARESLEAIEGDSPTAASARQSSNPTLEDAERAEKALSTLRGRILEDCERLTQAGMPEAGGAGGVSKAHLLAASGIFAHHRGEYAEADRLLGASLAENPELEEAWEALGMNALVQSKPPLAPGMELRQHLLESAEQVFTEGLSHDRGYYPQLLGRAEARGDLASLRLIRGLDPLPHLAGAEEDLTQALKLCAQGSSQERAAATAQRAIVRLNRAGYLVRRGQDPSAEFEAGLRDLSEVLALDKESRQGWWRRAMAHVGRGIFKAESGGNPLEDFQAAEDDLREAFALNKARPVLWNERSRLRTERGLYRKECGGDPRPDYEEAEKDADETLRLKKSYPAAWRARGRLRILRAEDAMARGSDPRPLLQSAEDDLLEGLRLEEHPMGWRLLGVGRRDRGVYLATRGEDPRKDFDVADAHFSKALSFNKASADVFQDRGLLRFEMARDLESRTERSRAGEFFVSALADFEEALKIKPTLVRILETPLRQARDKCRPEK